MLANFYFGHVPIEWLKLPLKTAQDARHFLFWRFFGPVPAARLILPLKTGQDARRFLFWRFFGPLFRSSYRPRGSFDPKNSTGRSPILCLAFFGPLPFPNGLFRSQMHPFRTLKVQHGGAPQGLAQEVLRTHCRLFCFQP